MRKGLALALLGASLFVTPSKVEAAARCDVVVVVADSLVTYAPTDLYLAAFQNVGFPQVLILAGAGRAIMHPDVLEDDTLGWASWSERGSFLLGGHRSGVDAVHFARWVLPGKELCWVIALGNNDAGHLPEAWWADDIDRMMVALRGDPAMWVTVWADRGEKGYTPETSRRWNEVLTAELAGRNFVCDWAGWATANGGPWLDESGVHLTEKGNKVRSLVVAQCARFSFK